MICSIKNTEGLARQRSILKTLNAMTNEQILAQIRPQSPVNESAEVSDIIRSNAYRKLIELSPGTELGACIAHDVIWHYLPPILFILGTVGNILSFVVLCQRSMIQISSYIYLATLAMVDETVLLFGLLRHWIDSLIDSKIENMSSVTCKLSQILGVTGSWLSVWLIVTLTTERVLVITFPLHAHRYAASPRRAKLIILAISLIFICANLHFVQTVDIFPDVANVTDNTTYPLKCDFIPVYKTFQSLWAWIDAFMYSYLPFSLITVMNIIIMYQVYKARRSRNCMMQGRPCMATTNHTSPSYSSKSNGSSRSQQQSAAGDSGRQLTIMLLVVSICFLITTTPIVIVKAFIKVYDDSTKDIPPTNRAEKYEQDALIQLLDTIAIMLMYMNHAMNFFLYCATGRKFRQTLKRLCYKDRINGRDRCNTTQIYYSTDRRSGRLGQPPTSVSNVPPLSTVYRRNNIEMNNLLPAETGHRLK